jgi:hypothetical protein
MKYYAVIKDGKLSAHKLIYTNKAAAEVELDSMKQLPHWTERLKGATVAEVELKIVQK